VVVGGLFFGLGFFFLWGGGGGFLLLVWGGLGGGGKSASSALGESKGDKLTLRKGERGEREPNTYPETTSLSWRLKGGLWTAEKIVPD